MTTILEKGFELNICSEVNGEGKNGLFGCITPPLTETGSYIRKGRILKIFMTLFVLFFCNNPYMTLFKRGEPSTLLQ